jgi:hypothetical protein
MPDAGWPLKRQTSVLHALGAPPAETNDSTIFNALTLLVVLGTSLITQLAGLSLALGAFLAGLLLAETEYHLQVGMGCPKALAKRAQESGCWGFESQGSGFESQAAPSGELCPACCRTPQSPSMPALCAGRVRHCPLQGSADGPLLHDWWVEG